MDDPAGCIVAVIGFVFCAFMVFACVVGFVGFLVVVGPCMVPLAFIITIVMIIVMAVAQSK